MFFKARPTTVDAAIAPLLQAIVDLELVADTRNETMARNRVLITSLETSMMIDQAEMERADAVAKMVGAITSPVSKLTTD